MDKFLSKDSSAADIYDEMQLFKNIVANIKICDGERTAALNEVKRLEKKIKNVTFSFYEDGKVESETWHNDDGMIHRDGGPAAVVNYNNEGHIKEKLWYFDGKIHRVDGPAKITYDNRGHVTKQTWYQHDEISRADGPAVIIYYNNGRVFHETWYCRGTIYVDVCARIFYDNEGHVIKTGYQHNDISHSSEVDPSSMKCGTAGVAKQYNAMMDLLLPHDSC